MTTTTANRPATDIIGPFSTWPRKGSARKKHVAALTGIAASGAVFAHCVLPVIT